MGTHPIFESDFDCLTETRMLEMERIRVRILHENKPYDGVFNQSDDMILLSLFMRVITGQTPSLPSGTFDQAGVKPDFYLINSTAESWPLKKWSALPDCIRQVCVSRDKSANHEPDREGDAKANGEPATEVKPPVKIVEEEKVALLEEQEEEKVEEIPKPDVPAENESNEATVESKPDLVEEKLVEETPVVKVEPELEQKQVEPEPETVKEETPAPEEVKQEPVPEPEPEKIPEPTPEPVKEETPVPAEPTPEPVKAEEPAPEPVMEETPAPAAAAPAPAAPKPAQSSNNKKKGGKRQKEEVKNYTKNEKQSSHNLILNCFPLLAINSL